MRICLLLLGVAALGACQPSAPDPRGVARDETLLTVSAMGRADVRPDEARLQLGVQAIGASANAASTANREKMEKVTNALGRLGVRPDDLQTRNLSLHRIDYGSDRGRFRAENILEVKLTDMNRVGEAVTLVTDAGANILSGPELRISDPEAKNRSAYAAAYRAARARADAYAGAAGLSVKRVLAIYDGGQSAMPPPPYPRPIDAGAVAEQAAPPPPPLAAPFNPGISSTQVHVRVDFALGR